MGDDKTKLLHALSIDRAQAGAPRRAVPWLKLTAAATVSLLLVAGIAWLMTSQPAAMDGAARKTTEVQPSPAVTPEPRRGGLSASGYIVARRKATVAAEITGKVVEVLIEEGMMVDRGPGGGQARQRAGRARPRARPVARARGRRRGAGDRGRSAGRRTHPRAHAAACRATATPPRPISPRRMRASMCCVPNCVQAKAQIETARRRCATHRLGARQAHDPGAVRRRGGRPQRPAGRDDLADVGGRQLHAHRHLHHRRHGFDRDRGRRQRGLHRPRARGRGGRRPCSTPIRTGPFPLR